MKKHVSMLITFVAAFAAAFAGLMLVASPAQADDSEIVIVSESYAEVSKEAKVTAETRAVINGATQVTWENPNHNIKITPGAIKKAPKIKTVCTAKNRFTQSRQIHKLTRGAKVVLVKPGSCLWNRGKNDGILVGFKWHVKRLAVLQVDKAGRYRHTYTLKTRSQMTAEDKSNDVGTVKLGGTVYHIIKTCANYIGGPVNGHEDEVIQVQYEGDVQLDIDLEAQVTVSASVKGSLNCPTGQLEGEASASASATVSSSLRVKSKLKVNATDAEKIVIIQKAQAQAKVSAKANAVAKLKLKCTGNPSVPQPQLLEIDTVNDVLVNNTRNITVSGKTAPGHSGELFCTAGTGTITVGKRQTVSGTFDKQITYKAGDEPGTDKVTCTLTQDDGQAVSISTNQFVVKPAPVDPL